MHDTALIACHDCDLLQRLPATPTAILRCPRCDAVLVRRSRDGLDRALALLVAAVPLLVMANVFPIVEVEVSGNQSEATLLGAVFALQGQGVAAVAWLVAATTLLVPALDIAVLLYLLVPVRLARIPPHFAAVYRLARALRPWGMVEVFLLGVLVSLVKLSTLATVVPGIALWSFGALMIVLAASSSAFDGHALWEEVERLG